MSSALDKKYKSLEEKFAAQIGELAQHELTTDPNVLDTSEWYLRIFREVLKRHHDAEQMPSARYLEVATYRHIMGYQLASEFGFDSTLFDISDRDLRIGRDLALEQGFEDTVDRVAGDFHDLPFSDNYFDYAYVSASLHHTLQPEAIISEMMRVLKEGGLFYCQREPCERQFCFYLFNANRPAEHTSMEAKLNERETLRLFSSPFHGARNADVFARIENDRIPLDYYYQVFAKYGEIVEQVLYHDGLLTRMDKNILEQENLPVNELTDYIYEAIMTEVEIMAASIQQRDILLGYRPPSSVSAMGMARRVANALKSRPEDKKSVEWQKSMVKIFGGNLRFVVRKKTPKLIPTDIGSDPQPRKFDMSSLWSKKVVAIAKLVSEEVDVTDEKFRRDCGSSDGVHYDKKIYNQSGLRLWEKMLPDIQSAPPEDLFQAAFIREHWNYQKDKLARMMSNSSSPKLRVAFENPVMIVIRYSVILDQSLYSASLHVHLDDKKIENVFIPQTESRMMRIACLHGESNIIFSLYNHLGEAIPVNSRLHISILQCVPVNIQDVHT